MGLSTLRSTQSLVSSVLRRATSVTIPEGSSLNTSAASHYSIVFIVEIEKASREFVQLFLQVLDDGQRRVVDFRNTVIIMTSNLGPAYLNQMGKGPVRPETRQLVIGAIQGHFLPEFINRIDEIIIFVSHIILHCRTRRTLLMCFIYSAQFLARSYRTSSTSA